MKYIIIIVVFLNIGFSNNILNYKIKYFGIYAADCIIDIQDTIYYNQVSKKINFIVKTKPFFDFLFPIDNKYSIILDENNSILFFQKTTSQPKVINSLYTVNRNGKIFYDNSDFEILPQYYNIFSILYMIISQLEIPNNCIIEREGLLYDALIDFNEENSVYKLSLKNKNNFDPIIEHTDIFTWALFKENYKREIFINPDNKMLEKCVFSKGLMKISAHLYIKN